ncbi:hypothetical protein DIPPA_06791 [Diplonema papillatum]|nr:hypothetical protein DIPPA_06791 [Diplonema papillatum]
MDRLNLLFEDGEDVFFDNDPWQLPSESSVHQASLQSQASRRNESGECLTNRIESLLSAHSRRRSADADTVGSQSVAADSSGFFDDDDPPGHDGAVYAAVTRAHAPSAGVPLQDCFEGRRDAEIEHARPSFTPADAVTERVLLSQIEDLQEELRTRRSQLRRKGSSAPLLPDETRSRTSQPLPPLEEPRCSPFAASRVQESEPDYKRLYELERSKTAVCLCVVDLHLPTHLAAGIVGVGAWCRSTPA